MIQVFRPQLDTEAILGELRPVLDSGWIGLGPKTAEFEERLAALVGAKHFIATNSCTGALHLAVHSLRLPPGSAVLTTPITFVSTNAVLLYENLKPVFCDVEARTGNLDAGHVAQALEHHDVKAIMVVHMGGYPAEIGAIHAAAQSRGIPVVEDCAHALGSRYQGVPLGAGRSLCCWSFQAVKNLPVGDGGGISTNDSDLAAELRRLRWLGISRGTAERTSAAGYEPDYEVQEIGFKYHMNDITAAVGLAMLPHLAEHNQRRQAIANRYLGEARSACLPCYQADRSSSFQFLPLFFEDRDRLAARLRLAGIFPGIHFRRNDLYCPFRGYPKASDLAAAVWYDRHELTLPLHPGLSDSDVDTIIEVVNG
jgi:dTDP-4-amino-4,6-dideoxygalactose transaminase